MKDCLQKLKRFLDEVFESTSKYKVDITLLNVEYWEYFGFGSLKTPARDVMSTYKLTLLKVQEIR